MFRLVRLCTVLFVIALLAASCGGESAPSSVPLNDQGFPTEWPVATPPGSIDDCDTGAVLQEEELFSVVMCLPEQPEPFMASQRYLATLESDGFVERETGAFVQSQATFLDGNGIEIYFQLIDNEATVILIKPAN